MIEELECLRELESKATKGPWEVFRNEITGQFVGDADGGYVAERVDDDDGAFIAALRNAVLPLLDRVAELERGLATMKERVAEQLHYDMKALVSGTPESRGKEEARALVWENAADILLSQEMREKYVMMGPRALSSVAQRFKGYAKEIRKDKGGR